MAILKDLIHELEVGVNCKVIYTIEDGIEFGYLLVLKSNITGKVISCHCSLDSKEFCIRRERCFETVTIQELKNWF